MQAIKRKWIRILVAFAAAVLVLVCESLRPPRNVDLMHRRVGYLGLNHMSWYNCSSNTSNSSMTFDSTLPLRFERQPHPKTAKVPSLVHFVFNPGNTYQRFGLMQYLSVASALNILKPQRVIIHYRTAPSGMYWDLIKDHVELMRVREINSIFNNSVAVHAHKADIIRLEALIKYGGIYLDTDIVVLRPFSSLLMHEFVMGQEGENGQYGLCNAVILANKDSPFLRRWYESYRSFDDSLWSYHSVQLPLIMSRDFPSEIHVVNHKTFFWPLWIKSGLQEIFRKQDYDYSSNLAVHTWNSVASREELVGFSQSWFFQCRSSFLSMMRQYVPKPLISVIFQCSAHELHIRRVMKNLISQSWPSWELIVMDDGFCGQTVRRLAFESIHVPYALTIHKRKRQGLSDDRNVGIRGARGIWILPLDSTDEMNCDFLSDAERMVTEDPRIRVITAVSNRSERSVRDQSPPRITLYTRSLWEEIGGYNSLLHGQDQDAEFFTRLTKFGHPQKSMTLG